MKFLWLDINASYSHSSMAFPALEAQISTDVGKKIEWHIVSGTIKSCKEPVISQVTGFSPDYIFATGWLFNIDYLLSMLRKINALLPDTKIVLGGPEFLGNNHDFLLENPFVTAVFKGDGEEVFCKMAELLVKEPNSMEWLSLPGFEYIDKNSAEPEYVSKQIVKTQDFVSLAAPEESRFFNWSKAFVQIETSRGCFNTCRFCVSGIDNSKVTDLPIDIIRERLKKIASKGIREIRVLDRTFNANSGRAIALLSLFEEFAGILKFHLEVHPALLNEKLKEKLALIPENLLHVEAGIQSLNDSVIENCRRRGKCSDATNGLNFLIGLGKFEVHTDFIAGLPGYSYTCLTDDIRKMMEIGPHEIQLELLKLLPGTYFRENADKLGIVYSPEPPYEVLQTDSITFDQLYKCTVLSKITEYWYNDSSWRDLFAEMATEKSDFLCRITDYLAKNEFMEHTYSYESKSMILYRFCKEHFPEYIAKICIKWVTNGLSIKKEPASGLKMWHFNNTAIANPVLDLKSVHNSYYFFENENTRHWFVFNKSVNREKPIILYKEIVDIS